ncbi:MAG: hypothetical protein ACFCU8_05095 [Thermosynechococcaceae cyanobacterium]
MLTAVQVQIIKDISDVNENPDIVTIKNREGIPQTYSYGLVSASRRDLDRLRDRQILSFRRGYCEPKVTEKGRIVLKQFQILQLLKGEFSEHHSFVDEALSEQVELRLGEVQEMLVDLKEKDLIDGYFCAASEQGDPTRLLNVWVTSKGKEALSNPDVWWDSIRPLSAVPDPPVAAQSPVEPPSLFDESTYPQPPQRRAKPEADVFSEKTRMYIEALRKLAQSLPEGRRPEVMALLRDLTQAVDASRDCA